MEAKKARKLLQIALSTVVAISALVFLNEFRRGRSRHRDGDDSIMGCYVFEKSIFTNPLSSSYAEGKLPYVYGFSENAFFVGDTSSGSIRKLDVEYFMDAVDVDVLALQGETFASMLPDLSKYKERIVIARVGDDFHSGYSLYRMDEETWLVEFGSIGVWSIYSLVKTDETTIADIERALALHGGEPTPAPWPANYANQMTICDVYALARKGESLTLEDFDPFVYQLTGWDFSVRRYDVVYADVVYVYEKDESLEYAYILSRRAIDPLQSMDLREGFNALSSYMNPFHSFRKLSIRQDQRLEEGRELLFEDDYFRSECRYYVDYSVGDIYVTLENDESMTVKDALLERRISIETAVANGLDNVHMVPIDNPLGGDFPYIGALNVYSFAINDEAFYPSKSFMYVVWGEDIAAYFDIDELCQFLDWYGYDEIAQKLPQAIDYTDIVPIAGRHYAASDALVEAGANVHIGWEASSHIPISFLIKASP